MPSLGPIAASPVNWGHPLNRGLYMWFLGLPAHGRTGGVVWRDLCANTPGTLTNMDPATDWVAGTRLSGTEKLRAIDFDGTNDRVSITDARKAYGGQTKFTVSAWIYPRSLGGGGYGRICTDEGTNGAFILLLYQNVGNGLQFQVNSTSIAIGPIWTANQWAHVVGVANGTNLNLYFNAVSQGTSAFSSALNSGSGTICIGDRASGSRSFDGQIDDVRIYSGVALSAQEVLQLYRESSRGYPNCLNRISVPLFGITVAGGTTYSLSASLGVTGALASSPTNIVATAEVLAAALSEAQAAVNKVVAGLSLSQGVLASPAASNSSVSATALSAGSTLLPSTVVQSSITGQLSVAVGASAAANLIASISIAAAVSVAEPVNATYPPILLSNTMSVAVSITEQLANAVALYETNAVSVSFTESLRNQVAATELLTAFAGLSESQTLQLATSIALATEEIVDALLAKISSDAVAMGASVSESEALTLEISEQIAIELLAVFQALLADGAPQVLVDLIRLVTDRWTRSDIIDEDFEAGQRL